MPFLKSWGNLLPDRWANFSSHLFPMFLNFGQKSGKKNHLFAPRSIVSPYILIERWFFTFFSDHPLSSSDQNEIWTCGFRQKLPSLSLVVNIWFDFVYLLSFCSKMTLFQSDRQISRPKNAKIWEKSPCLTFWHFLRERFELRKIWCQFWNPEEICFKTDDLTFFPIFHRYS